MDRHSGYVSAMKKLDDLFYTKLALLGFSRSKGNFLFFGGKLALVLNLQKSNYGDDYFINIGVWLEDVGGKNDLPKETLCHIRFRADSFLVRRYPDVDFSKVLRVNKFNIEEKSSNISSMVDDYIVPFIDEVKTIDSIKRMYRSGDLSNAFISKEARELLVL